jgi:C-terminal processing protease CtpA/Prc
VGEPVTLRVIRHRYDTLLEDQGRHRFVLKTALLDEVRGRYAPGATTARETALPFPALKLSALDPKGLIARLGFEEGDLVFAVDGNDVSQDSAEGLVARFAAHREGAVVVNVLRGGNALALNYDLQ